MNNSRRGPTTNIRSDVNRIDLSLNVFYNRVSSLWNSLTSAPSLKSFIERMSSWIILFQQLFGTGLLYLCNDIPSPNIRIYHYLDIGSQINGTWPPHIVFFITRDLWTCFGYVWPLHWYFLHLWVVCGLCNEIYIHCFVKSKYIYCFYYRLVYSFLN